MADRGFRAEGVVRGASIEIANEFAIVRVTRLDTRNGARLEIVSPRAGGAVWLDPLELETLSLQGPELFSRLVGGRADEVEG